MSRSMLHRLFSGLFAFWFVALGVTRGTYMACLDHRAAHLAEAAVLAGAQVAPPTDAHAGHGPHAGHAAGHDGAAAAAMAAQGQERSASQPAPPEHCTCAADCCCAVPAQAIPRTGIACAPEARVAPAMPEFAQTARPSMVVAHFLPFATAPPAAPLIA